MNIQNIKNLETQAENTRLKLIELSKRQHEEQVREINKMFGFEEPPKAVAYSAEVSTGD